MKTKSKKLLRPATEENFLYHPVIHLSRGSLCPLLLEVKMCENWRDYGIDDGGETCSETARGTLCAGKECHCESGQFVEAEDVSEVAL